MYCFSKKPESLLPTKLSKENLEFQRFLRDNVRLGKIEITMADNKYEQHFGWFRADFKGNQEVEAQFHTLFSRLNDKFLSAYGEARVDLSFHNWMEEDNGFYFGPSTLQLRDKDYGKLYQSLEALCSNHVPSHTR